MSRTWDEPPNHVASRDLLDLIHVREWDKVTMRLASDEGRREARRGDERRNGILPLHVACSRSGHATNTSKVVDVVKALLDVYPKAAEEPDNKGRLLPLHYAAMRGAQIEVLGALLKAYPAAARTRDIGGDLPLHHFAYNNDPFRDAQAVEKVELLVQSCLDDEKMCKRAGSKHGMLPLHIAAKYGLSLETLRKLLKTYKEAAKIPYKDSDYQDKYALDLLEELRPEQGTSEEMSVFNAKCCLLFAYNPDIDMPSSRRETLLQNSVNHISEEADDGSLSEASKMIWIWMCQYENPHDPADNFVPTIRAVLTRVASRKSAEVLVSIETSTVRKIREIATPACIRAINTHFHFLFAGRLELNSGPPKLKSERCVIMNAFDYGDGQGVTDRCEQVVVQFLKCGEDFDAEVRSRRDPEIQSHLCSGKMFYAAVPILATFDPMDERYQTDIKAGKRLFQHDLSEFPYAIVMRQDLFERAQVEKKIRASDNTEQRTKHEEERKKLLGLMPLVGLMEGQLWQEALERINEIRGPVPAGLLNQACKYGPPLKVVEVILQLKSNLFKESDELGFLPIHTVCYHGASIKVIELLDDLNDGSLEMKTKWKETPLEIAQNHAWRFYQSEQAAAILYLRRKMFPTCFESEKVTGLPNKSAFEKWAHIPPPRLDSADAICSVSAVVIYVDIAAFKSVNDADPSHTTGNYVMKSYGNKIKQKCQTIGEKCKERSHLIVVESYRWHSDAGDEFVVLGKFCSRDNNVSFGLAWKTYFKNLVEDISDLEENDESNDKKYFTFARVGCSAGEVSNKEEMQALLDVAKKLQEDVKESIKGKFQLFDRGDFVPLAEVQKQHVLNCKLSNKLAELGGVRPKWERSYM